MEYTFCKICNRVVWVTDVDLDGVCSEHKIPEPQPAIPEGEPQ